MNKFRIATYCIIYINRIYRILAIKDFKSLGTLGYEYLLRLQYNKNRYIDPILPSSNNSIEETNRTMMECSMMLHEDYKIQSDRIKEYQYELIKSKQYILNQQNINQQNEMLLTNAIKDRNDAIKISQTINEATIKKNVKGIIIYYK